MDEVTELPISVDEVEGMLYWASRGLVSPVLSSFGKHEICWDWTAYNSICSMDDIEDPSALLSWEGEMQGRWYWSKSKLGSRGPKFEMDESWGIWSSKAKRESSSCTGEDWEFEMVLLIGIRWDGSQILWAGERRDWLDTGEVSCISTGRLGFICSDLSLAARSAAWTFAFFTPRWLSSSSHIHSWGVRLHLSHIPW